MSQRRPSWFWNTAVLAGRGCCGPWCSPPMPAKHWRTRVGRSRLAMPPFAARHTAAAAACRLARTREAALQSLWTRAGVPLLTPRSVVREPRAVGRQRGAFSM